MQNITFHAIMSIIYMMKIILVGHIHEGVLHPPWTLSHPDFLNQVVPVSENLQFREKKVRPNARIGAFSNFKGQKHRKILKFFVFDFRAKLLS